MYTEKEVEVFRYCLQLLSKGCKSSFEAEQELYKKFWWISRLGAEQLVRRFWQERHKIEELLIGSDCNTNVKNYNVPQSPTECGDPSCPSS